MVYSNTQIRAAIDDGTIVCVPYNPNHVSQASLDITLGYYYFRTEQLDNYPIYNPFNKDDVNRYFGEPQKAVLHRDWCNKKGIKPLDGIPMEHPVIPLRPGERILAHSHEFFGILPSGGACELRARSSWGRNGIAVCFDAGWIDPGYINRLTLEVFNLNRNETILLPVGERIGQIIFHKSEGVEGNYGAGRNDGISGKYQAGTDLDTLVKNWRPELMLPQAYRDVRNLPEPIPGMQYD